MKRIGVLTSGGDAPGMNAAIRSAIRYAINHKLEVMGIFRGYTGLLNEEMKLFNHRSVSNIINRGGTILKTARCPEFMTVEGRQRAAEVLKKNKIDGLIAIGGNGTYHGAIELVKAHKVPCIGVPGTIDNDINGTDSTIGSDTAVNTALEAIDKIRDTATSMERIFVVEVMGRDSGFIAMEVGIGGGAEDILVPERKFSIDAMCHDIVEGNIRGKISWIIVVAEGAGKAADIAKQITDVTSLETRVVVLGHVQRGGAPTARDRILGTTLGAAAVDLLLKGESGKAVGVISNELNVVDLETAVKPRPTKINQLYELMKSLT
jgi:6-phosphofructokinase 1